MTPTTCPFCHSVPYLQPHGAPGMEKWQVICPECQGAGPVMQKQDQAVLFWNTVSRACAAQYAAFMEAKDWDL